MCKERAQRGEHHCLGFSLRLYQTEENELSTQGMYTVTSLGS